MLGAFPHRSRGAPPWGRAGRVFPLLFHVGGPEGRPQSLRPGPVERNWVSPCLGCHSLCHLGRGEVASGGEAEGSSPEQQALPQAACLVFSLLSLRQRPGGQDVCFGSGFCCGCWWLWRGPAGVTAPRARAGEVRGIQGPPGYCWGGGWKEMWGWVENSSGPQTDGSNFQSRGAGLNRCPCSRPRVCLQEAPPKPHVGPDAALVFVYLKTRGGEGPGERVSDPGGRGSPGSGRPPPPGSLAFPWPGVGVGGSVDRGLLYLPAIRKDLVTPWLSLALLCIILFSRSLPQCSVVRILVKQGSE